MDLGESFAMLGRASPDPACDRELDMTDKPMSEKPKRSRPAPTPTNITKPFWDAVNRHKLMLQRDPATGRCQFYPRAINVYSGRQDSEWIEASGKGKVYSFTETYVPSRGFEGMEPYLIACVELDEGVRLMSLLHKCTATEVKIGMPVKVFWDKINDEHEYFAFEPDK
jgi:uncharacterized OB-fold protein